ncbi:MAG: hypothetical protein AB1Z31_15130 [Desulfobacterales bacterium]
MGGIGMVRIRAKIGLRNMAYNMIRYAMLAGKWRRYYGQSSKTVARVAKTKINHVNGDIQKGHVFISKLVDYSD